MARPLRIEKAGGWYHVTSRGNGRKSIYRDDRDREHFLDLVADMVSRFRVRLHGYPLPAPEPGPDQGAGLEPGPPAGAAGGLVASPQCRGGAAEEGDPEAATPHPFALLLDLVWVSSLARRNP